MRALGLDIGTKTIGVAASDELGLCAHPLKTLARQGNTKDVQTLVALIRERAVEVVIAGLPLGLDGQANDRCRRIETLCDLLRNALSSLPAPPRIELWDERFSTAAVERTLIEADLSRKRRKQVIDRAAAAYILQGWLDAQRLRSEQ